MPELGNLENVEVMLTILIGLITLVGIGLGVQRSYYRNKVEVLQESHKNHLTKAETQFSGELSELKVRQGSTLQALHLQHEKECAAIRLQAETDNKRLREIIERELSEKQQKAALKKQIPLVQEVKMVYVKYIHIRNEREAPVYSKYINRLEKSIDVHSEYHYYRFNKYNRPNNEITIKDASSGVVDLNILHPWKELEFTDRPSKLNAGKIGQHLENSDVYFTSTVYYNGFNEGNEDIGMRMEMDTLTARMIADFSSIIGLEQMFSKPPDAYLRNRAGEPTRITSLLELSPGVYYLEVNNLKKGESLMMDFHVDWSVLT
ncbi:hypothetical protein CLV84_2321 [Neolewinella xylanilytica]|uniref:Uncharacterized protein n=1 Tax=Neolewinella xylanilytica TaxID=1514080 RepID=A0A2S6I2L3_9BACT|nr:hypothetical protein [Neolewinella xylanilytica]PPK85424.1 hypothetical protein CLV84_2321 [Neolewinella xylanilytica]